MDDYELPAKKRKYTKRKKDEDPESSDIHDSGKQDPEQEIVKYVEDLEKEAIRQQKMLEVNRAKHRQIISRYIWEAFSFAKMLDYGGTDSSQVSECTFPRQLSPERPEQKQQPAQRPNKLMCVPCAFESMGCFSSTLLNAIRRM